MPDYFDSGFCVRRPSWHAKETLLLAAPTSWPEARTAAGLDWEPEAIDTYTEQPLHVYAGADLPAGAILLPDRGTVMVPSTRTKTIVRSDTRVELGPVGLGFDLMYHSTMGEIVEAIVDQGAKYDTGGACREGAQVWVTLLLDEPYQLAGDDTLTLPYVVVLNCHDGNGAAKAIATQVRVVCANTYEAAEMDGKRHGRQFTFRHTQGINDRIEEAKAALSGARQGVREWQELAAELYGLRADGQIATQFLSEFIPMPPAGLVSDRVMENVEKARSNFRRLLESPTNAAHAGTGLALVNASVEYLDHVRGFRNADTYLKRTLLRPEPLKAKAVALVRELCLA
jgi:phage/plasmid-like protein (TIGR03299 family)